MPKLHDDARHVVPAKAVCLPWVGCDAVIQKSLDDLWYLLALLQPRADEVADLLVGLDVPDAITSEHNEFVVLRQRHVDNVRRGADHLLLVSELRLLLVLHVSDRPRQVQVPIDAVVDPRAHRDLLDLASGLLYAAALCAVVGFVVVGELDRLSFTAKHGARVACVGTYNLSLRQQDADSGAPDIVCSASVGVVDRSLVLQAPQQRHLHHDLSSLLPAEGALSLACAKSDWIELCRTESTLGFGVSAAGSSSPVSPSAEEGPEPVDEPFPGPCFSDKISRSCSGERNMSSMVWKPCVKASPKALLGGAPPSASRIRRSCLRTSSGRCARTNWATSPPPWPSKTPKIEMPSCSSPRSEIVMWASSMFERQPCIALQPHECVEHAPEADSFSVFGCDK
eukprot:CAMPEP_0175505408 /NCGR_PEP_ID=MMETSP0096-20121207/8829_1 /TAXON_ID=311494 /ORGANISM="Alexandrium monilatum, Strain CCMP3105" /LENGTH=395 /DNA_ID=CAMNT_0016807495 /DNA_START=100 /DNA_END=1288 /DNA_ORIENTATION=+